MNNLPTHIAELTKKRKKWVEANRENGFEEGITNLLTDLYPDNAHFIYELLQNAEDTQADAVRFNLSKEDIRFEHNGKRLFNLKDVESITSIGVSTKRNDPTNIGKFGVGFKAVFAYTNNPEIHSGDYRFKIYNLVVPESLPDKADDGTTGFLIPFDNLKKAPSRAVEEIGRGLRSLADNTLLFLNHIREIDYHLPESGKLKRIDVAGDGVGQRIEIQAVQPEGAEVVSNWLRYQKEVSIMDEGGVTKRCQVAIAFRLEQQENGSNSDLSEENTSKKKTTKVNSDWIIVPCDPGQVSIFFPAEKETSNLRFHLHAPFASTVARDSVRDCESNKGLRDALAQLTVEALTDIRNRGLLTMSFLAVLPNEDDAISDFYQPIQEAIVKAFRENDLLPTKSGTYLSANALYRGPADISSVINDNDLAFLTDRSPPLWAANAPQRGQREDKFLDSLYIESWGWNSLKFLIKAAMQNDEKKCRIEKWISEKPDAWVMRFYALMELCHLTTKNFYDPSPISDGWSKLAGIRTTGNNGSDEHVTPRDAYFPKKTPAKGDKPIEVPAKIRLVKFEVYDKGRLGENTKKAARDFLERVGVREYDERAEIERRLESYSRPAEKTISENHYRDIRLFIAYLKRNPADAGLFQGVSFLVTMEETQNQLYWEKPVDAFLDNPYETTGIAGLTAIHNKQKVWPDYVDHLGKNLKREEFVLFLKAVGVFHELAISEIRCSENDKISDWTTGRFTNT